MGHIWHPCAERPCIHIPMTCPFCLQTSRHDSSKNIEKVRDQAEHICACFASSLRLPTCMRGVHCTAAIPSGNKPLSQRGKPGPCPRGVVPLHSCRKAQDTWFYFWPLATKSCFHLNRSKWASLCIRGRNLPLLPVTGDQLMHTISSGNWERSPIKKLGMVGPFTCSIFGVVPHSLPNDLWDSHVPPNKAGTHTAAGPKQPLLHDSWGMQINITGKNRQTCFDHNSQEAT